MKNLFELNCWQSVSKRMAVGTPCGRLGLWAWQVHIKSICNKISKLYLPSSNMVRKIEGKKAMNKGKSGSRSGWSIGN